MTTITDAHRAEAEQGTMTTDTDKLREILTKATPGEWRATPFSSVVGCPITSQPDPKKNTVILAGVHGAFRDDYRAEVEANASAIVALHNAAPTLLDELDRLRAELSEERHAHNKTQFDLAQAQAKAEKLAEALKGHETHMAQMQAFAVQYLTAKASRDNFIDAMIYRLDGPEQRAVQKSARQALTEWSAK